MNKENTMINLIFDPGKGRVAQIYRETPAGSPLGTLPVPVRRGYRFDGWYLGDVCVTEETVADAEDMRLVARWSREKSKDRKRSMLKRQKIALLVLSVCAVVLSLVLVGVLNLISIYTLTDTYTKDGVEYSDTYKIKKQGGVYKLFDENGTLMERNLYEEKRNVYIAKNSGNHYEIDEETGEYKLFVTVDVEGLESAPGQLLLMFPQISSVDIYSVTVKHGEEETPAYRFLNEGDGAYIDGYKDSLITYDENKYAYLCMSAGYPLTTMKLDISSKDSIVPRLEDGRVDYSVYGLDQPQATVTVSAIKDKKAETYEADPARTYTMLIGDRILSGTGFYVKLDVSDSIYIISSTYIEQSVLLPIEELIVPKATYPVSFNEHTMVRDFFLTRLESWGDGDTVSGDAIVAFDYEELDYRKNTLRTTNPYVSNSKLLKGMSGYEINDGKASDALQLLYTMEYVKCHAIGIKNNPEKISEFGLDKNVFYLTYEVKSVERDENGNLKYDKNVLIIGEKTEDGTHLVASLAYDMIVEVDQYYLSFLEWDNFEWYNQYFMSADVSYLKELSLEFSDGTVYDFILNNKLSYAYFADTKKKYEYKATDVLSVDKNGDYWVSVNGAKARRLLTIDFDTVERYTHFEADQKSAVGNILYCEDMFYYYDSNKQLVRVTPDYAAGDTLVLKDGIYEYTKKGMQTPLRGGLTTGNLIYRFEKDFEITVEVGSTSLLLLCDLYKNGRGDLKNLLDYESSRTYVDDNGATVTEKFTATDNFRNFYMQILQYSLRGDVDEKDFEKNMGMSVQDFLASEKAKTPDATITTEVEDYASVLNDSVYRDEEGIVHKVHKENISRRLIFRFYRYSDMKVMLTLEAMELDENGVWQPSSEAPLGRFFVSASQLDKLKTDAQRLIDGEWIDRNVKH